MTTLGKLKSSVDAWLIRDDISVADEFPEILLLAEADIATDVRCLAQETTTTLTFTGQSAELPADYMEERFPFIDDNIRKIAYMTPKVLRENGPWQKGRVGAFYTLEGGGGTPPDDRVKMVIAGAASATDPLDIDVNYIKRFSGMTDDADTNWLLRNFFNVYLYSTLRAAAEFIQEDILEDRYAGKYEQAVGKLAKQENRKRFGGVPKQAYGSPRAIV